MKKCGRGNQISNNVQSAPSSTPTHPRSPLLSPRGNGAFGRRHVCGPSVRSWAGWDSWWGLMFSQMWRFQEVLLEHVTAPSYQNIAGFFNLMRKAIFVRLRRTALTQINFYLGKQPKDQRRLVLWSIKHLLLLHCRTRTTRITDIYQAIVNSWAKFQMNEISHLNQNGQLPFCLGPRMPETCLCFWRCSTTLPTSKEMSC